VSCRSGNTASTKSAFRPTVNCLRRRTTWSASRIGEPSGCLLYHPAHKDSHYWRKPVFSPDGKIMAVVLRGIHVDRSQKSSSSFRRLTFSVFSTSSLASVPRPFHVHSLHALGVREGFCGVKKGVQRIQRRPSWWERRLNILDDALQRRRIQEVAPGPVPQRHEA